MVVGLILAVAFTALVASVIVTDPGWLRVVAVLATLIFLVTAVRTVMTVVKHWPGRAGRRSDKDS